MSKRSKLSPRSESVPFGLCASNVASIRQMGGDRIRCASEIGYASQTLPDWAKRDEKELRRANEILKPAIAFFLQTERRRSDIERVSNRRVAACSNDVQRLGVGKLPNLDGPP